MVFMLILTLYYVKQESTVYQGVKMPDGMDPFKYLSKNVIALVFNES